MRRAGLTCLLWEPTAVSIQVTVKLDLNEHRARFCRLEVSRSYV
jgi:hypothetical protein